MVDNHRDTPAWHKHQIVRAGELIAIIAMLGSLIVFARTYDNRIVLLEERVNQVMQDLKIMQSTPGNVLTQPSSYSLEKFREQDGRMSRIESTQDFQRDKIIEMDRRVNEIYYSRKNSKGGKLDE